MSHHTPRLATSGAAGRCQDPRSLGNYPAMAGLPAAVVAPPSPYAEITRALPGPRFAMQLRHHARSHCRKVCRLRQFACAACKTARLSRTPDHRNCMRSIPPSDARPPSPRHLQVAAGVQGPRAFPTHAVHNPLPKYRPDKILHLGPAPSKPVTVLWLRIDPRTRATSSVGAPPDRASNQCGTLLLRQHAQTQLPMPGRAPWRKATRADPHCRLQSPGLLHRVFGRRRRWRSWHAFAVTRYSQLAIAWSDDSFPRFR